MNKEALINFYNEVRNFSLKMVEPLEKEDFVVQPITDVSPAKWHLGHVTWFFERVILNDFQKNYKPYNENYYYIFNSYYNTYGARVPRPTRGFLSRPTVDEVIKYRKEIDKRTIDFIEKADDKLYSTIEKLVIVGLNHEQQHQELFFMDIKYSFWVNPLKPALREKVSEYKKAKNFEAKFVKFEGGVKEIGYAGDKFAYDNETPKHKIYLNDYELMNRLVTNKEYLEFMEDKGYETPEYWLSDGWDWVQQNNIDAPSYWDKVKGNWFVFTLNGFKPLVLDEPVSHVSHFEANAFAKWKKARLPTEAEWENAAIESNASKDTGNFLENNFYHPTPVREEDSNSKLSQMIGDLWEWTESNYLPYPGYKVEKGALGEYNSKFMSSQMVLKGGSAITFKNHARVTYRNFFQPDKRWPFTSIRLARDV